MYNKVILIGNLTRDIEFKTLPTGLALSKSAIATSYKFKTAGGEQKEEVCFLDFSIFGRTAEVANQYLKKGSRVMLEGRLQLDRWTDSNGNNRSKHSLNVESMKMLGGDNQERPNYNSNQWENKGGINNQAPASTQTTYATPQQETYGGMPEPMNQNIPEIDISEDEIPF